MTDFASGLSQAVQDGDDKKVVQLVKEALAEGLPAMDILEKDLVPGVQALESIVSPLPRLLNFGTSNLGELSLLLLER